jgi:hypothetical protein
MLELQYLVGVIATPNHDKRVLCARCHWEEFRCRDGSMIYWRLLCSDPALDRQIVLHIVVQIVRSADGVSQTTSILPLT